LKRLRGIIFLRIALFQVSVNLSLVVTQDVFSFCLGKNIIRADRNLTAAARAVDHIGRDRVSGGMPA
jgi:hypothetical protein